MTLNINSEAVYVSQEQLGRWEDYETTKSQLQDVSETASERMKHLSRTPSFADAPPSAVAESVHEQLISTKELLASVKAQQPKIDRLHVLGDTLGDMASEARQEALRLELAAITDRNESMSDELTTRITRLEALDRSWAYLATQSDELSTLLADKQAELRHAVEDSSLTPDQQYEIVKVRNQSRSFSVFHHNCFRRVARNFCFMYVKMWVLETLDCHQLTFGT